MEDLVHISEITKKIDPNSLSQIKDYLKNVFTHKIFELISFFFERLF